MIQRYAGNECRHLAETRPEGGALGSRTWSRTCDRLHRSAWDRPQVGPIERIHMVAIVTGIAALLGKLIAGRHRQTAAAASAIYGEIQSYVH